MTAPRELADVAAELETLRQASDQTRTELRRTQATMAQKRAELTALDLHACQLAFTLDMRRDRKFALFDEWCALRDAHATAEALVDEDGEPAQALPHARLV